MEGKNPGRRRSDSTTDLTPPPHSTPSPICPKRSTPRSTPQWGGAVQNLTRGAPPQPQKVHPMLHPTVGWSTGVELLHPRPFSGGVESTPFGLAPPHCGVDSTALSAWSHFECMVLHCYPLDFDNFECILKRKLHTFIAQSKTILFIM